MQSSHPEMKVSAFFQHEFVATQVLSSCVKIKKQHRREFPCTMPFKVQIIHRLSKIRANYFSGHTNCGWRWQTRGWRGVLHSYQGVMSLGYLSFFIQRLCCDLMNCIEMNRIWLNYLWHLLSDCALHWLWWWLHQGLEPGPGAAGHLARPPVGSPWPGRGRGHWHSVLLLHGRWDQELECYQPWRASCPGHSHSDGDILIILTSAENKQNMWRVQLGRGQSWAGWGAGQLASSMSQPQWGG